MKIVVIAARISVVMLVSLLAMPHVVCVGQSKSEMLHEEFKLKNIQFNAPVTRGDYRDDRSVMPQVDETMQQGVQQEMGALAGAGRIAPSRTEATSAGMGYVIYHADYEARIEEEIAWVKERVQLEVFRKSGARIPLTGSGVGLKEVSLNQKPSMVSREGEWYVLWVGKPGKYTLEVQLYVKVVREREHGPGQFSFDVMPSPISLIDVQIEEPEMEIFVEPAIKLVRETSDDKTLATAVLPYTERLEVRWSKAAKKVSLPSVKLEPKLYVDSTTLVSIGEGVAQCFTHLQYSILQSEVSSFRIALPNEVAILDVQGSDLRDWKVMREDHAQVIDVYLTRGVKGPYELRLHYEKTIGEGSVNTEIPELLVLGVEREQGMVGIQAKTNVELAFGRLADAAEIDVKELPSSMWNESPYPILLAYKYLKHPYRVELDVKKHGEIPVLVAAIDVAGYMSLLTDEGKLLTGVTLHVRNNVKQFMRLDLPAGATFLSSFVSGRPVKPAQDADGRILIPLEKSETLGETVAQFPVEIMYLTQAPPMHRWGRLRIQLPKLDIPTGQLSWSIYAPEEFRYWRLGGDVKRLRRRGVMPLANFIAQSPRSSSDQADSQYAATQLEASGKQVMNQFADKYGLKGAKDRGALPIKMAIPTIGTPLSFSKLLVTDESPAVVLGYLRVPFSSGSWFLWLILCLVVGVVGVSRVRKLWKR